MQDEYDALIDNAVRSYAAGEPSPELATSILRRAERERLPRRAGWRPAMALALPVAAAVMLAVVLAGRFAMPPAPAVVATVPAVPDVQATRLLAKVAATPAPARAHTARVEVARSRVRMLPIQYTKEELALLAFVQRYPTEAASIAEAQERDLEPLPQQPITISRLKIAPLTISALNEEK